LKDLPKLTLLDVMHEVADASIRVIELGHVNLSRYFGPHTTKRNIEKIIESLQSDRIAEMRLGVEFFRQAHETWLQDTHLIKRCEKDLNLKLAEAWDVFPHWALLIMSSDSDWETARRDDYFNQALKEISDAQQRLLHPATRRQPITYEELAEIDSAMKALSMALARFHPDDYQEFFDPSERQLIEA